MRSAPDDRTARAIIRDEALRLFSERGTDAVTLRQIAAAAGVSPALVVHHFGSKERLREVVDQHVLDAFESMFGELTGPHGPDLSDPASAGTMAEALVRHLPADSPIPAYLRRMLLADSPAGRHLFERLFQLSRSALDSLVEAGMSAPGADPDVRAAVLMANDLAVLLMRDQLRHILGFDPLSADGMRRWGREMLSVYAAGLLSSPDEAGESRPPSSPNEAGEPRPPSSPNEAGGPDADPEAAR